MTDVSNQEQNIPMDLNAVDVGKILPDLNRYNSQFSVATYMFDFMMDRAKDDSTPREKTPNITIQDIYKRHSSEFESTGLSLEPVRGAATMVGPGGERPTSEMRLNLADGKKFQTYIDALKSETISPSQVEGLKTVAELLTNQLAYQYRLDDSGDERMMELFSNISGIVNTYRDLDPDTTKGLSKSVERLSGYWEIAKKKYLREYLEVEKAGLLNGERYFGPGSWHKDMGVGAYIDRWRSAVELAKQIGQNPNAIALQAKTISSLIESLGTAKEDLMKRIAKEDEYAGDYANSGYGKDDPERLIVVEETLKSLKLMKPKDLEEREAK